MIIIIWLLTMILVTIIICLIPKRPSGPDERIIIDLDGINIKMYGSEFNPKPLWVTEMLMGKRTDFGIYSVTVQSDQLDFGYGTIKVNPIVTNSTVYFIELDKSVRLYRGSPFIHINDGVQYTGEWYRKGNYIWLKRDLPIWYGDIGPSWYHPKIDITENYIEILWPKSIYYWLNMKHVSLWKGDIIYKYDENLLLGFGDKIVIPYVPGVYRSIKDTYVPIFDRSLRYSSNDGQIVPINLVVNLVKEVLSSGIPDNQAQRSRLNLLLQSIVNTNQSSRFFSLLPIIDLYLVKSSIDSVSVLDLLPLIGFIVKNKWNQNGIKF